MKEFWVYTALRGLLFLGSLGLVVAGWRLVAGSPSELEVLLILVVAGVFSGVGSYFLLNRPREALARRVQEQAHQAAARFEEMRSKEDAPED
ncbi:MAG: DUF4229 domain-containing protein [Nocardioides sp.]